MDITRGISGGICNYSPNMKILKTDGKFEQELGVIIS